MFLNTTRAILLHTEIKIVYQYLYISNSYKQVFEEQMSDDVASPILSPDSSISSFQAFLALVRTHALTALHQLISFSNKYTQVSPSLEKKIFQPKYSLIFLP